MDMLKSVHIEGFKSIRNATIELGPLTVLIGANGSGKSNVVSFLKMLKAMGEDDLQGFVARAGGPERLLYGGRKTTEEVAFDLGMQVNGRAVHLHDRLDAEGSESLWSESPHRHYPNIWTTWRAYHLVDTSPSSLIRQQGYIHDNHELHPDARNLAAYLYMLRETQRPYYDRIVGTFRLAAPWFDDFAITPLKLRPEDVKLDWRENGRDALFGPHQLSDGSLRTIALFTLLLQPEERLPSLIVIDEPELGLHPYAITLLASLLRSAAVTCQVIVATQSVTLVDHFAPEEIVVVERDPEGGTMFNRLAEDELAEWLAQYSIGELWLKNVIGGRP